MITIIDYGMGNCSSMLNMIKKAGFTARISSQIQDIETASILILPGVGAFDNAMVKLNNSGLLKAIQKKVIVEKTPFLGVCLGMQILFNKSDEGSLPGLAWLDGTVKKFSFYNDNEANLKIPHMGWNIVNTVKEHFLFEKMSKLKFYFVHSFYIDCPKEIVIGEALYGYNFTCAVNKENIFGVQFHPEKSHKYGMQFFKNFLGEVC